MKAVVKGYRPYSFTDKDSGRLIEGVTVYIVHVSDDKEVVGEIAEKFSVSKDTDKSAIAVGKTIELEYGRNSRLLLK
ncbi:MAG: hypothetical protein LBN00_02470 [Oscillospiraceae bacterium]|jgi:hypothetical protein|nr:hypothetical protein [Oscillospiraceae bacterium]